MNILLADDDIDDCLLFKNAIEELYVNANITIVDDGEQLMEYLLFNVESLPDVLFLDLSMPRKTGFECLCEIYEHEKLNKLHVVMFSTSFPHDAKYESELINTLLKIGAHSFIRKPDDFTQLKQAIENALLAVKNNTVGIRH